MAKATPPQSTRGEGKGAWDASSAVCRPASWEKSAASPPAAGTPSRVSTRTPSRAARAGKVEISGQDTSFSHLLTAWADMPSWAASCSWVQPFALRKAMIRLPKVP